MKLKDLGYALIGVFMSAKDKKYRESVIAAHKKWIYQKELEQRNFRERGEVFQKIEEDKRVREGRCSHRKGGSGLKGVVEGSGDDNQYAVIKHTHRNGDTHIHCLRCPKIWMPGDPDYYKALNFPTRNTSSTDVLVASIDQHGHLTGDFAEAFRKWTNVRPYKGFAFLSHTKSIEESTRLAKELSELAKDHKRPVTVRRELVPTLSLTEYTYTATEDNPKFNVINGGPSY